MELTIRRLLSHLRRFSPLARRLQMVEACGPGTATWRRRPSLPRRGFADPPMARRRLETCDQVNAKIMKDPRIAAMCDPKDMPFDCKRKLYGGFETIVQT